ncbi:hypothetical protein HWV62_43585 [Athelia sp. TMB]|nr:hypothetical protein HWV62_43585 [Athelia sp. TMB]
MAERKIEYVLFDMDAERQAGEHLLSFFPDIPLTLDDYLVRRNIQQDLLWPHVKLLPGVRKLVLHLHKHLIPIAVATGSRRRNYEMKTAHLGEVFDCFEGRVICGDDAIAGMRGKPEPDIFLLAAKNLLDRNVGSPEECGEAEKLERSRGLVFEDALFGMQAGKRAGMSVVWIPDNNLLDVEFKGPERADETLKSVEEFEPEKWGLPAYES